MPKIQIDLPKELNKELRKYCVDNDLSDKRIAIIQILQEKFKPNVRQGLKNLIR